MPKADYVSKAWTAACSRRPTHEFAEIAGPGRPVHVDGQFVGGIGCSSGTIQQDREVAMAGINVLASRTRRARRRS